MDDLNVSHTTKQLAPLYGSTLTTVGWLVEASVVADTTAEEEGIELESKVLFDGGAVNDVHSGVGLVTNAFMLAITFYFI